MVPCLPFSLNLLYVQGVTLVRFLYACRFTRTGKQVLSIGGNTARTS
jgi:hypothetical protein